MTDTENSTPALEDRLSAVVDSIKQTITTLPKFKPTDSSAAAEFEAMQTKLLDALIQISAAAAVDRAAIMLATDLAAQRKESALASQKLRDQADADSRNSPLKFPFQSGATA